MAALSECDADHNYCRRLTLEAAELEYQCLLTERAHFDAAYWAYQRYKSLGLTAAVIATVTTGSAASLFANIPDLSRLDPKLITGMMAILLAAVTAALNFLDPKGQRDKHDAAGRKLAALRADVRLFRRVRTGQTVSSNDLAKEFGALLTRHTTILEDAPALNDRRHGAAKNQLLSNVYYNELRRLTGRSDPRKPQASRLVRLWRYLWYGWHYPNQPVEFSRIGRMWHRLWYDARTSPAQIPSDEQALSPPSPPACRSSGPSAAR